MFEPVEPVTVCDQFVFFFWAELKFKTLRKPLCISLNRLIKRFGCDAIKSCQVGIDQYRRRPEGQDKAADRVVSICGQRLFSRHSNNPLAEQTFCKTCTRAANNNARMAWCSSGGGGSGSMVSGHQTRHINYLILFNFALRVNLRGFCGQPCILRYCYLQSPVCLIQSVQD